MSTFKTGSLGLGVAFVMSFACAIAACSMGDPRDDAPTRAAPSVGTVTLPVVAASALPQSLGARLGKKCSLGLPAPAASILFGPNAAPPHVREARRVIPDQGAGKSPPFEVAAGRISLKAARSGGAAETLGTHANDPAMLTSSDGRMTISVALRGASPAAAVATDGNIVYPGGLPGADVVQRPTGDGAEDWLLFAAPPSAPRVEYDVALTSGVASIRLVGRSVELLDAGGVPRLRMAPPVLVDDDCVTTPVEVAVTGCQVDTSPSDPRRRPHPAPGASSCRIALTWPSQKVKYPIALDPSWSSAASMASARAYHTAIRLPGTDRVLVAGGLGSGPYNVLASTEAYDPATDTWASYGTLGTARYAHAMTSFADGTILLAGGLDAYGAPTATAEATTGTGYFPRASMPGPAAGLTLDPLSAEWAIAAGGYRFVGGALRTTADAPVYFKAADQWYARTMPGGSRGWHASLATSTGVTFFGGERNDGAYSVLSSVVRYNSGVDTFSTLTSLPVARTKAGAALLASGTAVIAGGETTSGAATSRTDYAPLPATSPWTQGPNLLGEAIRPAATATMHEGMVTTGGYASTTVLNDARLFESATSGRPVAKLHTARYAHTATADANGLVLVAGGVAPDGSATNEAEWISDTVCNQGASEPPLSPSWGALTPGLFASGSTRIAKITNTTGQTLSGTLAIRAQGLDGREVTRTIWTGSVAPAASTEVVVAYSTLPIQPTNAKATAEIVAEVTGAPAGHAHLVGVSAHSPKLAYTFDPTYASVDVAGANWESPTVLEGVTSQADIAARMGPLAVALRSVAGKIWDGTQMVDIATLAPNLVDSVAVQYATEVFSNVDKSLFDIFPAPSSPNTDQLSGIKVCARLRAYYLDDGKGESVVFAGRAPTAFARTELYEVLSDGTSSLLWAGSADENGCAPRLSTVVVGHGYLLKTESRMRYTSRSVDVDVRDPITPGTGGRDAVHTALATSFSIVGSPVGTSAITMTFVSDNNLQASAAIGQALKAVGPSLKANQTMPVVLDLCQGYPQTPDKRVGTACHFGGTLWLGPNQPERDSHNVQWKFIIVHEFGHSLMDRYSASPSIYVDNDWVTYKAPVNEATEPYCSCKHVAVSSEDSHCIQSKEYHAGAATEALAHVVTANTWNPSAGNCNFVYYKEQALPDTGATISPPVPVSCSQQVKYLETRCLEVGRGIEWDWMNWMRAATTGPNAITVAELATVMARSCGGDCLRKNPTPNDIIAASIVEFGMQTPKALKVAAAIVDYGANY